MFEFLKDSNCVPDDPIFSPATDAINAQARAAFSSASCVKQKCREALVSHLSPQTLESINLALLATPSSSSLFSNDIIKESLTQVKEDP